MVYDKCTVFLIFFTILLTFLTMIFSVKTKKANDYGNFEKPNYLLRNGSLVRAQHGSPLKSQVVDILILYR